MKSTNKSCKSSSSSKSYILRKLPVLLQITSVGIIHRGENSPLKPNLKIISK